jgi:hypothetical protein
MVLLRFLDDGFHVTRLQLMVPEHEHMKIHEDMKLFLDFTHENMNALQHG